MENTQLVGITAAEFLESVQDDPEDGEIVEVGVFAIIQRGDHERSEMRYRFSTKYPYVQEGMTMMLTRAINRASQGEWVEDDEEEEGDEPDS